MNFHFFNTVKSLTASFATVSIIVAGLFLLSACAPEVGSAQWCKDLKEKPKGDWTANEIADFTQHCVF